ncbi:MAG: methyl-accepting chemotaxis protein [Elusimicrobia bacterium]|nr:methyl-accepting chemotaxis protein [Elusimicrobiota bacterium]
MTNDFKRRTILIKKGFQLKYIALVFSSVLIALLITGAEITFTLRYILNANPGLQPFLDQIGGMLPLLLVKFLIYIVIILVVAGVISHRIAGPIFRFEKSAKVVATGDLTHRVSLRSGDQLMELQEEFNRMVGNLQSLIQKDRTLIRHLSNRLDELAKKHLKDKPLNEDLDSLKKELEHITQGFKA